LYGVSHWRGKSPEQEEKMRVIILPNNLFSEPMDEAALNKSVTRWKAVLFISAACGSFSGMVGLVLSGLTMLGLSDYLLGVGHLGNWMVGAFFPLLIVAAHALDKVQDAKKALRLASCRKQGLSILSDEA
jgi:hypothetical protein